MSAESLRIAIILIPGFLSVKIRDFFSPSKPGLAFEQFMQSVAFSVANFTLAYLIWLRPHGLMADPLTEQSSLELLAALGVSSAIIGLAAGVVVGNDWHYRLARWLKLTRRTGRVDIWQDVFEDVRGNWVAVHLEDGTRLLGWAKYYSDGGLRPSVFLQSASWVEDDGKTVEVEGEGMLITEQARIRLIEFQGGGSHDWQ